MQGEWGNSYEKFDQIYLVCDWCSEIVCILNMTFSLLQGGWACNLCRKEKRDMETMEVIL